MAITSQFELEPLIIQTIKDLNLTGLKTVADETEVASTQNLLSLLPAAIVFTGQGLYSNGVDGGIQKEQQYWQLSILVPHIKQANTTTAAEAGKYITPILQALVGTVYSADFTPIEIVDRPQGIYESGFAEFPIVLKTSFNVEAA